MSAPTEEQIMERAKHTALTLKRHYPVPPEKVWRAWTDAQALIRWFKPDGFTAPLAQADVRVGGRYRVLMVDPEGKEYDLSGTYREVVPNRRLVMTWSWQDQPGETSLVTITLSERGGGTDLVLVHEGYLDRGPEVKTHAAGWSEALEQLGRVVLAREKS